MGVRFELYLDRVVQVTRAIDGKRPLRWIVKSVKQDITRESEDGFCPDGLLCRDLAEPSVGLRHDEIIVVVVPLLIVDLPYREDCPLGAEIGAVDDNLFAGLGRQLVPDATVLYIRLAGVFRAVLIDSDVRRKFGAPSRRS